MDSGSAPRPQPYRRFTQFTSVSHQKARSANQESTLLPQPFSFDHHDIALMGQMAAGNQVPWGRVASSMPHSRLHRWQNRQQAWLPSHACHHGMPADRRRLANWGQHPTPTNPPMRSDRRRPGTSRPTRWMDAHLRLPTRCYPDCNGWGRQRRAPRGHCGA